MEFLVKGFGDGVLSGGINLYMWVGYIIALALYAQGFVGYALTFLPAQPPAWVPKGIGVGIVLLFTGVNFIGARTVGRAETFIVAVKLAILALFAGAGVFFIHSQNFSPSLLPPATGIFYGAGVLFIGYEGFGLVTNTAEDMANPRKLLPQALYLSVIAVIFIYLSVSLAVIGNLDVPAIVAARDYALARGGQTLPGRLGVQTGGRGRPVFHGLGHQCHPLRRRQRQLYDCPGRGTAPVFCPAGLAPQLRGPLDYLGVGHSVHPVFRSLRGGHDGQRGLPADLRQRQRGPPEDHRRHRRQKDGWSGSPCSPA